MALPVFVSATAGQYVTAFPTNVTTPAGCQIGDVLLAFTIIESGDLGSITYPSGWVELEKTPASSSRSSISMAYFVHDGSATYPFTKVDKNSHVTLLAYRGVSSVGASGLVLYPLTAGADCSTESIAVTGSDSLEVAAALFLTTNNSAITAPVGVDSRVTRNTNPTLNVVDSAATPSATTVKTFTMAFSAANRAAVNVVLNGATGGPTPIAFTGTIPAQSATVGAPFSLNVASYFSGTQTPFAYAIQSGTLPAGLSFDTATCIISGTPTGAEAQAITIRGTDVDLATADSNSFTITVSTSGDVTAPTFTVAPAVSSVTQTGGSATATINETGSIFYVIVPNSESTPSVTQVIAGQNASGGTPLDSGSAVGTTTLSDAFTGLTASTAYKACFVARDDESTPNVQVSVTVVNFTTAAVVTGTFTTGILRKLVGGAVLANTALTYFRLYNPATGDLVVNRTDLSTDVNGRVTCVDAAITAGVDYKSDWLATTGETRMSKKAAT